MSDFDLEITQMDRRRHRAAVLTLVNGERRARNLPALVRAPSLLVSAQSWARSMSRRSDFSHGEGTRSFRVRALRFPFVLNSIGRRAPVAEVLAFATGPLTTPREVVKSFMASREHRSILMGNYRYAAFWTEVDDPTTPGTQRDSVTVVGHLGRRGP